MARFVKHRRHSGLHKILPECPVHSLELLQPDQALLTASTKPVLRTAVRGVHAGMQTVQGPVLAPAADAYRFAGAAAGEGGDAGSGPMAASTAAIVARMSAFPGSRLRPSSSAAWASLYCSRSTCASPCRTGHGWRQQPRLSPR